jgi:hypothetical protein
MKFTKNQIDKVRSSLKSLPKIEPIEKTYQKLEVVKEVRKEITELQKKGYSLAQIADQFTKSGIEMTTLSLKSYVQKVKPTAKNKSEKSGGGSQKDVKSGEKENVLSVV